MSIEDSTPPCPFEFFSLKSDESFCGTNITQFKDVKHNCPSVIKFSDLTATCDNPIETQWRFTKMYGVTEEHDNVICDNQEFCEIFTSYEITPELVVFRMINSTNHVIYSRIMKPKHKNYFCIDDCGHFNPETRKVTKANGKPLKLDFLARKMKRNDLLNEIGTKKELLKEINENITKRLDLLNGENENVTKRDPLNEMNTRGTKIEDFLNKKNEKRTKKTIPKKMYKPVTKRKNFSIENVDKREKLIDSETNRAVLNKDMIRDEVLNEINKSNSKDDLENEINDTDAKGDLVNETNDSDAKDLVNETHESEMCTDELQNEMNDSDANVDVLNDSTHTLTKKRVKLMKELLPMEENLSKLDWGGSKFDLVSVELNSLHKIKSRGKRINFTIEKMKSLRKPTGQQNTLASKKGKHSDSILHKPTVTPRVRLKKKKDYIAYEDENRELEYA